MGQDRLAVLAQHQLGPRRRPARDPPARPPRPQVAPSHKGLLVVAAEREALVPSADRRRPSARRKADADAVPAVGRRRTQVGVQVRDAALAGARPTRRACGGARARDAARLRLRLRAQAELVLLVARRLDGSARAERAVDEAEPRRTERTRWGRGEGRGAWARARDDVHVGAEVKRGAVEADPRPCRTARREAALRRVARAALGRRALGPQRRRRRERELVLLDDGEDVDGRLGRPTLSRESVQARLGVRPQLAVLLGREREARLAAHARGRARPPV